MMSPKKIKVKLIKSVVGYDERVKSRVRGLGLRKIGSSKELENTASVRGIIKSVIHMVEVIE